MLTNGTHSLRAVSIPYGGLVQMARTSALQAEGHRFESGILHHADVV